MRMCWSGSYKLDISTLSQTWSTKKPYPTLRKLLLLMAFCFVDISSRLLPDFSMVIMVNSILKGKDRDYSKLTVQGYH